MVSDTAVDSPATASTRTALRTLALLESVVLAHDGQSLVEAAAAAGLAPSTASRILQTMETAHYLARGEDGRFRPGSQMLRMAASCLQSDLLHRCAMPHLAELSAETGENAYLAIVNSPGQAVYIGQVESERPIRHVNWLGRTVPLRGTAIGRALRGDVSFGSFYARRDTIDPDVTAIATPVRNVAGEARAALSVVGPTYRVDDDTVQRFGELLVAHAMRLERELGVGSEVTS